MIKFARPMYHQLVVSIETLLDISVPSVEEVTTRLKAIEDDAIASNHDEEKLYLTEEQWLEKYKQKEPEGYPHDDGFDGHDKDCGGKNKSILTPDSHRD